MTALTIRNRETRGEVGVVVGLDREDARQRAADWCRQHGYRLLFVAGEWAVADTVRAA